MYEFLADLMAKTSNDGKLQLIVIIYQPFGKDKVLCYIRCCAKTKIRPQDPSEECIARFQAKGVCLNVNVRSGQSERPAERKPVPLCGEQGSIDAGIAGSAERTLYQQGVLQSV